MSVFAIQGAAVGTDSTIAGLPAEYVAQLATEALRGDADTSDAALTALSDVAAQSADIAGGQTSALASTIDGALAWSSDVFYRGWVQATGWVIDAGPTGLVWVAAGLGLLIGLLVALRRRTPSESKPSGHAGSPHRLAYATAVTQAAQLLATGEDTRAVAKASGLARDVIGVVRSRRLLAAPSVAAGSAGSESSSGRNRRRARAAYTVGGPK